VLPFILTSSSYCSTAVKEDEAATILEANESHGADGSDMTLIPFSFTALLAAEKVTISLSMSMSTS
jgi:hypothetical protein